METICKNSGLVYFWSIIGAVLIVVGMLMLLTNSTAREKAGSTISVRISSFLYDGPGGLLLVLTGVGLWLGIFMVLRSCTPPPSPIANQLVTQSVFVQLQQRLDEGTRTNSYVERRLPHRELVQNDSGRYYLIDLRDPMTGDSIFFDLGKYRKDVFSASFTRAWARVDEDIIKPMRRAGVRYQVFVVGSADTIGSQASRLGNLMDSAPKHVTVFPRSPENPEVFVSDPRELVIPVEYNNSHLPNLRASFIQDRLRDAGVSSTILDGSVHESYQGEDRNAVIVVYWPVNHSTPGTGLPN